MNAVDAFIEKWLEFDLKLREMQGLDQGLYEELVQRLKQIKAELADEKAIPKSLSQVFVDLFGATESNAHLYEGVVQQQIFHAADQLADLARDVCV
jgi:hypothetical protein